MLKKFRLFRHAALAIATASLAAGVPVWADSSSAGSLAFRVPVLHLNVVPTTGIAHAGPPVLDFGNVAPGATSASLDAVLSNQGTQAFDISGIQATGPFTINPACPGSLEPAQSCSVGVQFTPTSLGVGGGALTFTTGVGTQTVQLEGMGAQYLAAVNPASLDFGNQAVGAASVTSTVTLSNAGNLPLQLTRASTTGPFSVQQDNCGSILAASSMCTYQVAFQPVAMGLTTGSLAVPTAAGMRQVALKGVGLLGAQDTSTGSLSFPATPVGSTSAQQSVSLQNTGNIPLTVNSILARGAFAVTSSCPASLDAGASCLVKVAFQPDTMGAASGLLTLSTSLGAKTVSLAGAGLQAALALTPAVLAFGDEPVGTTSALQTATLTNSGNTAAALGSASLAGPYSVASTTCGQSLDAGASCSYSLSFTPTTMGPAPGTLSIPSDAGTQTVSMTGNGQQASGGLANETLDFGNETVGATSASQSVLASNTGNVPLGFNGVTVAGPYNATHNCPSTINVGASCTVNVNFMPVMMGAQSGALTVNTTGGSYSVNLAGTGLQAVVTASPTTLAFGSQKIGATTSAQTVTLTNAGNTSSALSPASATGPYALSTTCGASLAANASCSYSVTFTPTVMNAASGTLSIPTDTGTKTVSLSGSGQQTSGALNTSSLSFGSLAVSSTSTAQTVTLTNTGNTALGVSGISATGQFSTSNTCGSSVADNASCSINVTFAPTSMGSQTGTLSVTTAGGTYTASLSGTGLLAVVAASPSSLSFGTQTVGNTSASQTVTLANTGNTAASVSTATITGPFAFSTTCAASLAANASCTYNVTFTPTAMNGASGTLSIPTAASTKTVSLSGTGQQTSGSLSIGSLPFGNQAVNTVSSAQAVTVSNTGNASLAISGVTSNGQFTATHNCPAALAAGNSCTVNVSFAPVSMGAQAGVLSVATAGGTYTANLSGTGLQTSGSLSQSSLSFGSQAVSSVSATQAISVSNTGNTALGLTGISASAQFSQTNNCPASLAVGGTCTVNVAFAPTAVGNQTGTLTVTTAAGSYSTSLAGTGLQAILVASPTSLAFGTQQTGTTATKSFTLTNSGNIAATSLAINVPTAYSQTSNCGTSLAANAACTVQVTFNPPAVTAYNGTVSVTSSATTVGVAVTGAGGVSTFVLSTGGITMPMANVGTSTTATFTITNTGSVAGTASISATANFSATQCGSIPAGGNCTSTVTFTPNTSQTASQGYGGAVYVSGSSAGTQSISLGGTGAMSTAITGNYIATNDPVFSPNQQYFLAMQGDCNLVIYHAQPSQANPSNSTWNSGTASGQASCNLAVQNDGNLVIYTPSSGVMWATGTGGHPATPSFIRLDNNGILYMYNGTPSAPGTLWWHN